MDMSLFVKPAFFTQMSDYCKSSFFKYQFNIKSTLLIHVKLAVYDLLSSIIYVVSLMTW